MNVRKENYWSAIGEKLRGHEQVSWMGINYHERRHARTNLIRLSNKYPDIAKHMKVRIPTPMEVKEGPKLLLSQTQ